MATTNKEATGETSVEESVIAYTIHEVKMGMFKKKIGAR